MIDRKELEEYAKIRGLNLGQAEKDYLQTIMLFILYQKYGRELVFKGGTALNKCFNLDRFSQDIDFTSAVPDNFSKTISSGLEKFLIPAEFEETRNDSIKTRFKIKGPLYTGDERTLCFIVVDISLREKVILEPIVRRIGWNHPELPVFDVVVMREEEILGKKLGQSLRGHEQETFMMYSS
jgi:predicted nucleotidyltransferase component of viral defense system